MNGPVDLRMVIIRAAEHLRLDAEAEPISEDYVRQCLALADELRQAREAVVQQQHALRGSRDMLIEAAKQFRVRGDKGHAAKCERHANNAQAALVAGGASQ